MSCLHTFIHGTLFIPSCGCLLRAKALNAVTPPPPSKSDMYLIKIYCVEDVKLTFEMGRWVGISEGFDFAYRDR